MKKIVVLFLILALLLTGCGNPDFDKPAAPTPAATQASAEESDVQDETVPEDTVPSGYKQQTLVAVSMPAFHREIRSEDGNPIFLYHYQSMHLTHQDPEVVKQIIVDYLNRVDRVAQEIANASQTASETLPEYCMYYTPTRIDQTILSLYGTRSNAGEDGRPYPLCYTANYDMLTGDVLTLGSILSDVSAKSLLIDQVVQQADLIAEDSALFSDYADSIAERFSQEESYDEDWYFSETGLCFYFSPYEIAPYSSGIITISVPYEQLVGIIADEFFPPETEELIGSVEANLLSSSDMTQYTQIAEVVLDTEAEPFLLAAKGAVKNVSIDLGAWNEDGTVFIPEYTVFAASSLTPGDAVMLQATIPDTMPSLRITYLSAETVTVVYLSQSGMDGSAILTPAC